MILKLLTDILALLNTPQGQAVLTDIETILGITPPGAQPPTGSVQTSPSLTPTPAPMARQANPDPTHGYVAPR